MVGEIHRRVSILLVITEASKFKQIIEYSKLVT